MGKTLKKFNSTTNKWETVGGKITGDTLPIGSVVEFAGAKLPTNWLWVNSVVKKLDYPELYAILGDTYNDSSTPSDSFKVYNKQGLVTLGVDLDDPNFDEIGKVYGSKNDTHLHNLNGTGAAMIGADSGQIDTLAYSANTIGNLGNTRYSIAGTPDSVASSRSHNTDLTGTTNNTTINVMQPSVAGMFICKAQNSVGLVGNVVDEYSELKEDSYNCDYINNAIQDVYSEAEKIVGKWLDGRPVYKKTIVATTISTGAETSIDTGISDLDEIIKPIYCFMFRSNGTSFQIPRTHISSFTYQANIYHQQSDNTLRIETGSALTNITKAYITMEYTKTTDVAV